VKHKSYDIIVIGGGHAGIEAAWTSAGMGLSVAILTIDSKAIGRMSCNPAIGGTAKGHLVKEIDALGGIMGKFSDDTGIQFRMLNKSRGPAIWSPRCQNDRELYSQRAQQLITEKDNITVIEDVVESIEVKNYIITGVLCSSGEVYKSRAVIITSGTFMNAVMHTGLTQTEGGRYGEKSSKGISKWLLNHEFELARLKTGTPPRLEMESINFTETEEQPGDQNPKPFSHQTKGSFPKLQQISCYLTYTNQKTHDKLKKGFDLSPIFTGKITGVGPRYCPSIEDKIFRFADKTRHQIFLEPEGLNSRIVYMNGFSSSLPADTQLEAIKTIPSLQNAKMIRAGYAVEYDFVPTHQIKVTLESKKIEGLYFAGQINGTSGYEEAAAQGLIAGINASLKIQGKEPFILKRSDAYIGVLIDDLINKVHEEPYRIFTSCAEYRLLLRQDNADLRLMKYGNELGLIADETYKKVVEKQKLIQEGFDYLKGVYLKPEEANELLEKQLSTKIHQTENASQLIKRNEIKAEQLLRLKYFDDSTLFQQLRNNPEAINQIDIELKYEGYIKRQHKQIEEFKQNEDTIIPLNFDFLKIKSLSNEGKEKLSQIKPLSLGQASRIAGVSPTDVSILALYMRG